MFCGSSSVVAKVFAGMCWEVVRAVYIVARCVLVVTKVLLWCSGGC